MASLSANFSTSAGRFAKRALEAYATDELDDFVLFGGIAVEHAAKAKLSRENPAFIAPSGDFKSALMLHRNANDVGRVPTGVKTVGAAEAIRRLGLLAAELRDRLESAGELIALRNGQAHLGAGDETQRRRVFIVFLRAIQDLLQIEPAEFWSPHYALVQATLSEHAAEIERDVAQRISAARIAFDRRFGALSQTERAAMLNLLETQRDSRVDNDEILEAVCPACESGAVVEGYTEQTDWEVDYDDGVPIAGWPVLTFYAMKLACDACGLRLVDPDELSSAGMEWSWINEDIDIDTWIATHASDDDYDH